MALIVNSNLASLNAQRNLSNSQNDLNTALPVSYTHLTLPTNREV